MITTEQWEKIDQKYGRLMLKISHQISGDAATSSFDDNLQDIRLAAMEAVAGFEKQNNGHNGTFDLFWGSSGFDRYIKTCMWTKKHNKGAKITKKSPILKGIVSTEKEEVLNMQDSGCTPEDSLMLEELSYHLTPEQRIVVTEVVRDPKLIKPNGKINVKRLSEKMNTTWFETNKYIDQLSTILDNEF